MAVNMRNLISNIIKPAENSFPKFIEKTFFHEYSDFLNNIGQVVGHPVFPKAMPGFGLVGLRYIIPGTPNTFAKYIAKSQHTPERKCLRH